ncbi:hypothetical protein J4450_01390 [Candidatus Micrarchaeota archaeon]|nr:hypothetical protein [Candidatus Micrarchaeota archaeon]
MTQRQIGKGHYAHKLGTRRDGFTHRPKRPNGFKGKQVLLDGVHNPAASSGVGPVERFISLTHERARRFDPFPTSWGP